MKTVSILFAFLILANLSYGQELFISERNNGKKSVFEKYDFNKGGYSLFAMRCTKQDSLANIVGDFYIDDMATLEKIKEEWLTFEIEELSPTDRAWSYLIYICKNKIGEGNPFEIGLKDEYILPLYGWKFYRLETKQLLKYKSKFKNAIARNVKLNSLIEARRYYNSIREDDSLVYSPIPIWINYEGEFSFVCNKGFEVQDSIEAQIKRTYSEEPFKLELRGQNSNLNEGTFSQTFVIYCNKSLWDKFKLYNIYDKYYDFSNFELTTYWKVK